MKILVVDDTKTARYALRIELQKHGVEVDMADSAESALEILKTRLPDAILMDHIMTGMNGLEALEIIKADPRTAHIPVVMATSQDDPEFAGNARRKGALGILPKSIPSETQARLPEVLARLRTILAAPAAAATPIQVPVAPTMPAMPSAPATAPIQVPIAPLAAGAETPPILAPAGGDAVPAPVLAIPQVPPVAPSPALAKEEVEHLVDLRLDLLLKQRLRSALDPMLEQLRRELTDSLLAEIGRSLDSRLGALRDSIPAASASTAEAGPSPSEIEATIGRLLAARLDEVLDVRLDRRIAARVDERLTARLDETLASESTRILSLLDDRLTLLRAQIPPHEAGTAALEQRLAALDDTLSSKALLMARRESQAALEQALDSGRQSAESIETLVENSLKSRLGQVYPLIAGAALAGISAAAAVYLLLR